MLLAAVPLLMIAAGGLTLAAGAAEAPAVVECSLVVPPDPLSAVGLATPYQLSKPCHQTGADQAAFVQGTILDPATGRISVYNPLVVDEGTQPAALSVVPTLPAGAVVGLWFGFNGDNLTLKTNGTSLADGNCVNGLGTSVFGQFAFCNAGKFFNAANAAIAAGKLKVPPVAKAKDGLPCPTTRDFGVVDMDQSDNVTTSYLFLADGTTAQDTAMNRSLLAAKGAQVQVNGSDNLLLNDFIMPALGCAPFTAPDLADPGRQVTSLALNELQAAAGQAAPIALVPTNDPMAKVGDKESVEKTNLYRTGVNMAPVDPAKDTPEAYCRDFATVGLARMQLDAELNKKGETPDPATGDTLFSFLAARWAEAFNELGCGTLLQVANPVTVVTNAAGVAVDATFALGNPPPASAPPASGPAASASATAAPAASKPAKTAPPKATRPAKTAPPKATKPAQTTAPAGGGGASESANPFDSASPGTPEASNPAQVGGDASSAPAAGQPAPEVSLSQAPMPLGQDAVADEADQNLPVTGTAIGIFLLAGGTLLLVGVLLRIGGWGRRRRSGFVEIRV